MLIKARGDCLIGSEGLKLSCLLSNYKRTWVSKAIPHFGGLRKNFFLRKFLREFKTCKSSDHFISSVKKLVVTFPLANGFQTH